MKTKNQNITSFDEHLDNRFGKVGTKRRTEFEIKAKSFAIGEIIKEERMIIFNNSRTVSRENRNKKKFYFKD